MVLPLLGFRRQIFAVTELAEAGVVEREVPLSTALRCTPLLLLDELLSHAAAYRQGLVMRLFQCVGLVLG